MRKIILQCSRLGLTLLLLPLLSCGQGRRGGEPDFVKQNFDKIGRAHV